jgi:hypothetical protein
MSSTEDCAMSMKPIFRSNEVDMSELHKLFQSEMSIRHEANKGVTQRFFRFSPNRIRSGRREAVAPTLYLADFILILHKDETNRIVRDVGWIPLDSDLVKELFLVIISAS